MKASLVKPDSHIHARTRAWTIIKTQSSNLEQVLAVESHEWLSTASLVVFLRLVKYPTKLSVIYFQDANLASLKLSVAFFNDHCSEHSELFFSSMFQCLTCKMKCCTGFFLLPVALSWVPYHAHQLQVIITFPRGEQHEPEEWMLFCLGKCNWFIGCYVYTSKHSTSR